MHTIADDKVEPAVVPPAADSAPWPNPRSAWKAVWLLTFIQGVNAIDRNLINLLVDPIKADLQISDTQVGLLLGFAFAIFYTTMGLPIGRLVDSYSRRTIIFVGATFWSLMTFMCGLAQNFAQLFSARVAVGAGEASLNPAGYSLISDYFPPEQRAKPMGVFIMGHTLGSGVALFIGGAFVQYLMDNQITLEIPGVMVLKPWQIAFCVAGLPGVLLALMVLKIREPRRREMLTVAPATNAGAAKKDQSLSISEVVSFFKSHSRLYLPIFLGFGLVLMWEMGKALWAPTFLIRTYGWSPSEVGLTLGIISITFMSAGAVSSGWVSEKLSARGHGDAQLRAAFYAAILCLPFAAGATLVNNPIVSVVLLCPVYFLGAFPFALAPAVISTVTPNQMRGQITALYLLSINLLGYGLGPAVIGALTDHLFKDENLLRYSMCLTAVITLTAASVILWISMSRYRDYLSIQNTRS